ncbi:MAG: pyruvate kinase [Synergistaceae bacterium]|jgi:pyruvate kinase|nr:pyruvate kinase [Synergistaceae bacterium]
MFVKIVCTIGPASEKYEVLRAMAEAGMNVARLNFSHGDYEGHERKLNLVRRVERDLDVPIAALLDTKGPEIRTGEVENGEIALQMGSSVVLTTAPCLGTPERVHVNYPLLAREVVPGQSVFIDDGTLHLDVEKVEGDDVLCRVVVGGPLRNTKGVNIPGAAVSLPALSEKDKEDIAWGVRQGMEYLAVSFVKTKSDILEVRKLLKRLGGSMKIIAKIETREAVANIEEIAGAADGMMIARGDLGVEIPTEDVPLAQKRIIELCRSHGKVVIVATQMLDSMIRNPRPTRAEANDVANAVLDGTDAVMLSGETASGAYPVESVATMRRIVDRAEQELEVWGLHCRARCSVTGVPDAVSDAAVLISRETGASAIISLTKSGTTARMISKHRPSCPILGLTPSQTIWRELALWWGVRPVKFHELTDISAAAREAVSICVRTGRIRKGELVVITGGVPVGLSGTTNMVEVLTTGEILLSGISLVRKNAAGKVCVVRDIQKEEGKIADGCVLVVRGLTGEYKSVLGKVGAVVSENGVSSSEGNMLAMEYDVPCIVGASDALSTLTDGMEVTVDGMRGLVYDGQVKLVI